MVVVGSENSGRLIPEILARLKGFPKADSKAEAARLSGASLRSVPVDSFRQADEALLPKKGLYLYMAVENYGIGHLLRENFKKIDVPPAGTIGEESGESFSALGQVERGSP